MQADDPGRYWYFLDKVPVESRTGLTSGGVMAGDHREPRGGVGAVFGMRLSACRRSAGLTQQELADRSGLSVRAISNLELGRVRTPHPGTVRRLADALGLDGDSREAFLAAAGRRLGGGRVGPGSEDSPAGAGRSPLQQNGSPIVAGGPQQLSSVVPRQLPPAAPPLTGRGGELGVLSALLERLDGAAGTHPAVVISAIGGTAGVGKTALAVRWAHQVAGAFPDGQLYVNLRGYDPGPPVPAEEALAGVLRALAGPGQDIPAGSDERTARYRSLLAGRRVLVVLDNARDVEQVRPLLPGAPGCLAVVTSRNALAGLIARDGAER